jgi:hypothetical protein
VAKDVELIDSGGMVDDLTFIRDKRACITIELPLSIECSLAPNTKTG